MIKSEAELKPEAYNSICIEGCFGKKRIDVTEIAQASKECPCRWPNNAG